MAHTSRLLSIAAAALAIAVAPAAYAGTELLNNGSFETIGGATPEGWGGLTYYAGGSALLPGWTVAAGSVDLTSNGTFWGPAYDGTYSLDINGWNPGTLTQSFATVLGQTYNVSFAYSRNVAGAENPATATVAAGGHVFNVSAANDGTFGSGYNMRWLTGGFSFVGTGSPTTLAVTATNGTNGGVFFDKFSVQSAGIAPVPEPAAWTMMILGFGLSGALLRQRRATAAAVKVPR